MADLKEIIKTNKPIVKGKLSQKFILSEAKAKNSKVERPNKKIEILGVSYSFNQDGKSYYIGFDGTDYYLFTGSICGSLYDGDNGD